MNLLTKLPRRRYRCDHCGVEFTERLRRLELTGQASDPHEVLATKCPSCEGWLIFLVEWINPRALPVPTDWKNLSRLWPTTSFLDIPTDVAKPFADDLREAAAVLAASPKASAALSRRLLQRIFHERLGITKKNLADEVATFLSTNPPSHLAEAVDHIRVIGNFAAHPINSTHTGEIVDVESGEAEWLLSTIAALFDFVFVQPAHLAAQKAALNAKLQAAGKAPIK